MKKSELDSQLKRFVVEKRAQAIAGAKTEGKEMLPEFESMFAAAAKSDWLTISNIWEDLRKRAPQYEGSGPKDDRLHGTAWQTMLETWGAFGNIIMGGENLVNFGEDIVQSIKPGSIYFGGTDPGRCVITALQKSHVNAEPFFTLTQNALADASYLEYLRTMYRTRIYIPTDADSQNCFEEYTTDAQRRLKEGKLKPGESVKVVGGKVQASGQVAVMAINALLAKRIFDKNPNQEFYIEESFPLDWMFPYLVPNGPILKVNREVVDELSGDIIQHDRAYWIQALKPITGSWLRYETPLAEVTAFALNSGQKPPKPDPYVHTDAAQKWSSKLRSSIAGLYHWRVAHARNPDEKERMLGEADFAFRQAFALCPYSPEAVYRYVSMLVEQKRFSDAALLAETAVKIMPENEQFRNLAKQIQQMKSTP